MAFYKKYDIIKGREKVEEGGIKTTQSLLESFRCAFAGIGICLRQRNFRIEIFAGILALLMAYIFSISQSEWIMVVLCIMIVLPLEAVNTATEILCDTVHPQMSDGVKKVKDVAAGAVLIASIFSAIIGIIIFIPKIIVLI